jgi:hypothetical protein
MSTNPYPKVSKKAYRTTNCKNQEWLFFSIAPIRLNVCDNGVFIHLVNQCMISSLQTFLQNAITHYKK